MKKFSIFMMIAVAMGMVSCTAQGPKANLKTEIDTLSYTLGMIQTQGLKPYLVGRMGVDTTYMADFIKGVNEGVKAGDNKKQSAYYAGIQIGQQLANQMLPEANNDIFAQDSTKQIDMNNFMSGFITATLEQEGIMSLEEARTYFTVHMEAIKAKIMEEKYADNKAAGEKFLEENKAKDGVKTTESGLQYKVLVEGNGPIPADSCRVKVNYTGRLIDGTVFDTSTNRKDKDGNPKPASFSLKRVVKGWTEALCMMPVGSKWEIYVPQELGYGARDNGKIKPFSTLIFEIELVEIEEKKK